jgi:flavin-dependent dehydrogenase
MSKSAQQPDVLVLGDHPCAYLACALLRQNASIHVTHAVIPGERIVDRLVLINPAYFELHPLLASARRKLDLTPIYGLKFLADDPATSTSHGSKSIGAYVASYKQVRSHMRKLAEEGDSVLVEPKTLTIEHLDESGLSVVLDHGNGKTPRLHSRLLLLAGALAPEQRRMIGLPDSWDEQVLHRYTFVRLKGGKWFDAGSKPLMPMSLDLRGTLNWGWLLPGDGQVQVAVHQPVESVQQLPPVELLAHWIKVLIAHKVLDPHGTNHVLTDGHTSIDLPLGGALSQEGVANRTLLIGPAGGFYTACAEDIYPTCWSAVFAADVAKKALRERHVQDALQPYRLKWGATLGDYLRGPQQNLRFLLPLVYRNAMMTARLAEAILLGKSVVR